MPSSFASYKNSKSILIDKGKPEIDSYTGIQFFYNEFWLITAQAGCSSLKVYDLRNSKSYLTFQFNESVAIKSKSYFLNEEIQELKSLNPEEKQALPQAYIDNLKWRSAKVIERLERQPTNH